MSDVFAQFVRDAEELAKSHGLVWDCRFDPDTGKIDKRDVWDLSALAGSVVRPRKVLASFGISPSASRAIEAVTGSRVQGVMSLHWRELYKAIAIHDILVKGNGPGNFASNLGEGYRALAGVAGDVHPAEITPEMAMYAYNAALAMSDSGKRGTTLKATIATWFDKSGIASARPLAQACVPIQDIKVIADRVEATKFAARRQIDGKRPSNLRSELTDQHFAEKLPEPQILAELIRIVFTENPATYSDLIRFNAIKVLIATGLRVGELVSLPADCLVENRRISLTTDFVGPMPLDLRLKLFAEKQGKDLRQAQYVEGIQHVPSLLAPTVWNAVRLAREASTPLRRKLKLQRETGRLFPEWQLDELVPWSAAYSAMSGMVRVAKDDMPAHLVTRYRESYEVGILAALREQQAISVAKNGVNSRVNDYFRRAQNNAAHALFLRHKDGQVHLLKQQERVSKSNFYVLVSDMEAFVRTTMPTKMPDLGVGRLLEGEYYPEDRLFLYPGRALAEAKHDAVIDLERYFSIKSLTTSDIEMQLSAGMQDGGKIFQRYGLEEHKLSKLNPHSLRHLQNTELFRHGVADTIITKRFNRKSTAQSYVYDHRTLAEHLDEMDPQQAKAARNLGDNARKAFVLMREGKIQGPVVSEFKRLQKEVNDEAAFEYLNAEAGALHFTPYGFCLNSFAASPCVKHLECFNSCNHLVRTDAPEEKQTLETLKNRYMLHIGRLRDKPSMAPQYENQLRHAETRLQGIVKALEQQPGDKVFPEGSNQYKA